MDRKHMITQTQASWQHWRGGGMMRVVGGFSEVMDAQHGKAERVDRREANAMLLISPPRVERKWKAMGWK